MRRTLLTLALALLTVPACTDAPPPAPGAGRTNPAATQPGGGSPVCGSVRFDTMTFSAEGGVGTLTRVEPGTVRVDVTKLPPRPWHVNLTAPSAVAIAKDDVVLVRFQMRTLSTRAESGEGVTNVIFEEAAAPHAKSLDFTFTAGREWKEFVMGFKAGKTFAPGEAQFALHLAGAEQSVELRGLEVITYGKRVDLKALPVMRVTYAGRGPDAPWRKAAAERIEKLRKGDLTVEVVDASGKPVAGARVAVKMTKHAFAFGSAVTAWDIAGASPDAEKIRAFVAENFNRVVFENDLKWPQWESERNRAQTLTALAWLEAHDIQVRGHCLVWPSWKYTPKDVEGLKDTPDALRKRVRDRVTSAVSTLKGRVVEWDVLNEVYANHQITDVLGEAEVAEWFRLARAADPKPTLFVNDYGILSGLGLDRRHQDAYFKLASDLKAAGAPVGGVGMQSHFGAAPTPPERMLKILDRFAELGLAIEGTEFDVRTRDEDLQADFTRDYLTVMFSHPAVNGVVMWGFWEGRHWIPEAALFRRDWTIKPNGQAWLDLVKRQWWTDTAVTTDAHGVATVRGFCGTYEITVRGTTVRAALPREGARVRVVR